MLKAPEPGYLTTARKIGVGPEDFITQGLRKEDLQSRYRYQASDYKQYWRLRVWSNHKACSMCRYAFLRIRKNPLEDIKYTILMYLKLLKYAVKGGEIMFGSEPEFDQRSPNVICVGNCTKKVAREKGYVFIPGCPPQKEQMLKYFCRGAQDNSSVSVPPKSKRCKY